MGLLDDLRNQADSQRASEEEEAARKAEREQFYLEKIQPRMIKTYQFFKEFIEHLNYVKLEPMVEYPLLPGGAPLPLRQQNYKVVIDSSKALKKIDFTMEAELDDPVEFEMFGKEALLAHADRIERYSFRHDRKDRKDADGYVQSAKFILVGPLPLKITVEADIDNSQFKVTVRNFSDPGFTKYNLTLEQFSDEFLDQLGKFVIRQEDRLFGKSEELSEEAKKQLRDRMIVEQRIRQQELIEAEERRKAEEAAELEKSAKEQIKRVLNTKVAKGKESLKDMFSKLKKQAGFDDRAESNPTSSAQPSSVTPSLAGRAPAAPATKQAPVVPAAPKTAAARPAQPVSTQPTSTQKSAVPPVTKPATAQQTPAAPTAPKPTAVKPAQPAPARPVTEPAQPAAEKPVSESIPTTEQTPKPATAAEQTQPPKVFTAPSPNPFLTPETDLEPDLEPKETPETEVASGSVPNGSSSADSIPEQMDNSSEDKRNSESPTLAASSHNPLLSPEALERDLANIIERDKSGNSEDKPGLEPPAASAQTSESPAAKAPKPFIKPGELITDLSMELQLSPKDSADEDKSSPVPTESATPTQNPFLTTEAPDIDLSGTSPQVNSNSEEKSSPEQTASEETPNPFLTLAASDTEKASTPAPHLADKNSEKKS